MNEEKRNKELKERIDEKIKHVEECLERLNSIDIPKFEQYQGDFKIKAVFERYFEMIIEDIISIAFLIIREKRLSTPESEEHAFLILSNQKIISPILAKRLKEAKDMRNRIVHNYITINDLIVYTAVTEELCKDAEEFLECIKKIR